MVAGLSGLATCLQSNFIGPNFHGVFSNLGICGLFQLSLDMFPFSYWAHVVWLAPGSLMGLGNLTISGETVWAACHGVSPGSLTVSASSWSHGLQPTRLLRPWDFLGKSTGVGCHCLLRYHCPVPTDISLACCSPSLRHSELE